METHKAEFYTESVLSALQQHETHLTGHAVPKKLAEKIAGLSLLMASPDIIAVAHKNAMAAPVVGKIYFTLGAQLGLDWLRQSADAVAVASYWERMALQAIINELSDEQRRITDSAVTHRKGLEAWLSTHSAEVARFTQFIQDIKAGGAADIPKLTIALKHLRRLAA